MSNEKFLKDKLSLLQKDNQNGFKDFVGPMHEMADKNETSRVIKIPADGNWFKLSFDAVQLKEDRAVITAHRIYDGMTPSRSNSSTYEFRVEFQGTRAGYLFGEYHQRHPLGGWPFISWDVRSYVNSLQNPGMRIYVSGFYAHNEIKRMIIAMQSYYGAKNIVNSYINDNLQRFKAGIAAKKTVDQIEKDWSRGMMESLGYKHVEASGSPKGTWNTVKVHWFKDIKDALNEQK